VGWGGAFPFRLRLREPCVPLARVARDHHVTAVDIRTGTQTATGALLRGLVGAGVAALGIAFASSFEEDVTTGQILGISFFSLGIFGGVGAGIGSGISNWGPAP
jgi:hypothetical protein